MLWSVLPFGKESETMPGVGSRHSFPVASLELACKNGYRQDAWEALLSLLCQ